MNTKHATTTPQVGTVVHVDPKTLVFDRNIRDAQASPELVASVKSIGVIEPITAVVDDHGTLLVRQGQRRTLAAVEAGCDTVPVYVEGTANAEADTAAEALRVIRQRDENTHRQGLTAAEEVGVVQTLTGLGLTAAQVTKKARIARGDVDAALTVLGSELASKAVHRYEALTLDQAAVVADFEDDAETVKALVVASHQGDFEHVAQQARDLRAQAQHTEAQREALRAAGITLLDEAPEYSSPIQPLSRLVTSERDRLDADTHGTCPGHVAWLELKWAEVDQDGEVSIAPDSDDYSDDEEGQNAYADAYEVWRASIRRVHRAQAVYGCADFKAHGHVDRYGGYGSSTNTPKAAELSEKEREAKRVERRLVIDNNKAWSAAQPVRRKFLADLATTKTAPKNAARFIATALCGDGHIIGATGGNRIAAEALGKKPTSTYGRTDCAPAKSATDSRCLLVALVQILGDYEGDLTDGTWRQNGTTNAAGRYLRYLESIGYKLSDVEKYAISKKTV